MIMRAALVVLLMLPLFAPAQNADALIPKLLARITAGEGPAVREELQGLLTKYPNHPGILYVQGLLTANGAEAVRIYQSIVDNFPKSEWADDALFKVYQFYYALGLYRTADLKLQQLQREYPASPFHAAARKDTVGAVTVRGDTARSMPPTGIPAPEQFTLQLGAFSTQANADRQRSTLEAQGYPAEVVTRVRDGRSMFLVLHGTFATADAARARAAEIVKKLSLPSFVITR